VRRKLDPGRRRVLARFPRRRGAAHRGWHRRLRGAGGAHGAGGPPRGHPGQAGPEAGRHKDRGAVRHPPRRDQPGPVSCRHRPPGQRRDPRPGGAGRRPDRRHGGRPRRGRRPAAQPSSARRSSSPGNHEYFYDAEAWCEFLPKLGVRVLRNERVAVGRWGAGPGSPTFDLAGIDDRTAARSGEPGHGANLTKALAAATPPGRWCCSPTSR